MPQPVTSEGLARLGVCGLATAYASGAATAREATQVFLARIDAYNPHFNAYITLTAETALAQADAADARRAAGAVLSPLDGVPLALKDNIDLAGAPTSAGIEVRRARTPARDSEIAARLRAAGAVFLGKLNMDEAALGATTRNPSFGACLNPHRDTHVAGGSSGGAAVAVAAGLCAAAVGTDTLGSVRLPAAFCGVVGYKPTYGRIPMSGVVPLSRTLDHLGLLTSAVRDIAPLLNVTADDGWPRGLSDPGPTPDPPRVAMVIGRLSAFGDAPIHDESIDALDQAAAALRVCGIEVRDVVLDGYSFSGVRRAAVRMIQSEAALTYADDLAAAPEGFSPALRAHLAAGAARPAERLADSQRELEQASDAIQRAVRGLSALLLPTTLREAFPLTEPALASEGDLTALANFAGLPAVTLPVRGRPGGLPLGVQLIGAWGDDLGLLRLASVLEAALPQPQPPSGFR